MHNLFSTDAQLNHGDMMTPIHGRLIDVSMRNLSRAQEYFRRSNYFMQNQHVLTRLIKMIPLPNKSLTQLSADDVQKYYDDIRDKEYRLGNSLGLVTSTSYGRIYKSQFYPNEVMEILISTTVTYKEALLTPWQDLEPVQVHRHPYDTTNFGLLDRRQILGGKGVAIISINIPLLALQFLKFQQHIALNNVTPVPTYAMFLAAYPLQNMVKTHNDIAMINRTIKAYRGIKGHDMQPRQAFWLHPDQELADSIIGRMVPEIKRTPRYFESILMQLPTVYRSGYNAIRLPIDMDMRQNRWVWILARMWIIDWLLEVEFSFNRGNKEGALCNKILKSLQGIRSDNSFRISGLPDPIWKLANDEMNSIEDRIKKKK